MKSTEGNWRSQELSGSHGVQLSQFVSNKVNSTRYNLLTLLPKNLFEQFQRSANIWFLLVSIFQLIPFEFNPVDSWTTVVPLAILICLTLLKDAYNDYYRGREDFKVNNTYFPAWNGQKFEDVKCEKLLVGTIVMIYENEKFPADVIVLGTQSNRAFLLDNSGINGESELMSKKAVSETHGLFQSLDKDYVISKLAGVITFELPSSDFSKFKGKLKLSGHPKAIQLFCSSLAYRGSVLKGTEWVVGVVVYSGLETKTYLNISKPPKKVSKLEKKINKWVLYLLILLLILVIFSVMVHEYLSESSFKKINYLNSFVMFTILYNNIIPISLFVTMDMLRIFQTFFIARRFNKRVDFNTGDVNENLGQVEYIFTDKTGTITENELKLQLCIVKNIKYRRYEVETDRSQTLIDDEKPVFTRVVSESTSKLLVTGQETSRSSIITDRPLPIFQKFKQTLLKDESSTSYQYLKCMSICNSVQVIDEKYSGISREEVAMVEASSEIGVKLYSRNETTIVLDCQGSSETLEVLALSPFNSYSKVCRILVKRGEDHILYLKGSYDRLIKTINESGSEEIESHYNSASKQGLRTIVCAYKKLTQAAVTDFLLKLQNSKHIPINSEGRIENNFIELEKDSSYLGLAGIEDIVKPETIDTIKSLQRAGIKLWVLSGDNEISTMTTARKVGLVKTESTVVNFCGIKTEAKCINILMKLVNQLFFHELTDMPVSRNVSVKKSRNFMSKIESDESIQLNERPNERTTLVDTGKQSNAEVILAQHPIFKDLAKLDIPLSQFLERPFMPDLVNYVLIMDRDSFHLATETEETRKLLTILLFGANSVIFHGLLPLDKAKVVNLVKNNFAFRPVTLAVGDGNADIPMIQAADVGIGIMSKEGSQAKSHSDIGIEHFSLLKELLLLHGHWNYSRMSRSVLLFIYKNVLLIIVTFAYIFISDYSGESIFSSSLIVGFNIGFTSLPILALGVFDEDLRGEKIYEKPEIYSQGLDQSLFGWKRMLYYTLLAIVDGIIIPCFFIYNGFTIVNDLGMTQDQTVLGTSMYIVVVFAVLIQIALDTYCFSYLYIASHLLSVLVLAAYLWLVSLVEVGGGDLLGAGTEIISSPCIVISLFFIPLVLLGIHQAYVQYSAIFKPGLYEKVYSSDESGYIPRFNRLDYYSNGISKVYRETSFTKNNLESDAFEIKRFSLHFNSRFIEAQYREFYIFENIKFYKLVVLLLFILLVLWTILEAFVFGAELYFNLIRALMCAGFLVVVLILWTEFFMNNYVVLTIAVIAIGLVAKFAAEIAFLKPGALATGIIPAVTYVLFNVDWQQITYLNGLNLGLYTISISIFFTYADTGYSKGHQTLVALNYLILNFAITFTSAILGYHLEKTRRLEYKLISIEKIDVDKSQRILSFLLPAFVKKRVKDGARYIAEDQGTVTVVFCDIMDFDSICAEYEPKELVDFIDTIFQKFDQLSSAYGVTKIETVGKTYMACAGLKDSELEMDPSVKEISHARRAIELGLAMISLSSTIRLNSGLQLQVKIGINSGPVTAGVVGHHKPQFSLVGDTVNTASRMCSTIELANSIQISKECYDLIDNFSGLEFTSNTIEAKGKGTMHTYIVSESKVISPHESTNKIGFNHMNTILQHSSFARTMTEGTRIKRRTSELLNLLEFDEGQQGYLRSDTEILGKVKLIDFSCEETEKQTKFRLDKTQNDQKLMFLTTLIALITFSLLLLISLLEYTLISKNVLPIFISRFLIVGILTFVMFIHSAIYLKRVFPLVMILIFFCMIVIILLDLNYNQKESDAVALEVMFIVVLAHHSAQIPLSKVIPAFILIFIPWGILGGFSNDATGHAANCAFVIVFAIINSSAIYTIENHLRTYFNLRGFAEKEISKTDKLLTQMMPPHVLENMRQDRTATDSFNDVTLLYADIVGFTAWSSDKSPKEVVGMLSELFTRFDKKCLDHHVYKVHTIGDCYVIMGLMTQENRDIAAECLNVVNMGKSMIRVIHEINQENGSQLNMRIGIHVGSIIAGITGTNIVRYDIYGPDVLMANKMESGGLAGKINVSDVTMETLEKFKPGLFKYEFNKEIYAKVIEQRRKCYFLSEDESA